MSRKVLGCSEIYWELDYNLDNRSNVVPFRVFVANDYYNNGNPPPYIRIGNSNERLYMAFFPIDFDLPEGDHALVFVYQPSENEDDRCIYQKRFHMGLNKLLEDGIAVGSAAVGAALGSLIPRAGTVLGAAVGGAVGSIGGSAVGALSKYFLNSYTGHYLRYVS